ncbi:hypothetical protein T09_1737 [Trichinella sp. T9]|nr:hypothetical protein T09_1737 [Trichinella sp. T9]
MEKMKIVNQGLFKSCLTKKNAKNNTEPAHMHVIYNEDVMNLLNFIIFPLMVVLWKIQTWKYAT